MAKGGPIVKIIINFLMLLVAIVIPLAFAVLYFHFKAKIAFLSLIPMVFMTNPPGSIFPLIPFTITIAPFFYALDDLEWLWLEIFVYILLPFILISTFKTEVFCCYCRAPPRPFESKNAINMGLAIITHERVLWANNFLLLCSLTEVREGLNNFFFEWRISTLSSPIISQSVSKIL